MPYQDIKTQRHIFNWYYQSCVTKLDVGVFALQLFLSPSLIKFCSIYTLAWETDSAYYCFRTSNIIANYCNTCCLTFWYMTSLLLNVLLGFEQKTPPLLSYNREVRIRPWRVGLFDFGSGSGRVWPKKFGFQVNKWMFYYSDNVEKEFKYSHAPPPKKQRCSEETAIQSLDILGR